MIKKIQPIDRTPTRILSGYSDRYSRESWPDLFYKTNTYTKTGKGGKKKGGSNRRVVELNARVEKKDQLAIHHASIPPSSLARIRNQLTVRLFQRGVARTSEKTGKSGTIQKRDKMINRRG